MGWYLSAREDNNWNMDDPIDIEQRQMWYLTGEEVQAIENAHVRYLDNGRDSSGQPPPEMPAWVPAWPWFTPSAQDICYNSMVALPEMPVARPQMIHRYTRLNDEMFRAAFTWFVQTMQLRYTYFGTESIVLPPCDWCGLPTFNACGTCQRRYICWECTEEYHMCMICWDRGSSPETTTLSFDFDYNAWLRRNNL